MTSLHNFIFTLRGQLFSSASLTVMQSTSTALQNVQFVLKLFKRAVVDSMISMEAVVCVAVELN